ncbi:MAG TPA: non-homologous end-joining DNA ligase [Gaiellaceae bacterium]|nr:non-homologous end-joining DNA ligase [Gaiellaceae bacterium]
MDERRVRLTSPERLVWPRLNVTKRDVFEYYARVAPLLVPHLADRPVTLTRFPEGVERYGWYQTQCRGPAWVRRRRVATQDYCLLDDAASLLWAVNAGTVELHPLLSRGERVDEPTALVFDLDPGPPAGLVECSEVALQLRAGLAAVGLDAVVKTTGSLGLHLAVPLAPGHRYAETKPFARLLAERLAADRPDRVVATIARSARAGKVLVDWAQNARARSLVAPYSLRATAVPAVSTPVAWEEVEGAAAERRPERLVFSPAEVLERVERIGDLFVAALAGTARLPSSR